MLYYFFNITNIFEYTEKVKEFYSEPPRIFNYIFIYLLYTIISSNHLLTINLFILIVWNICCNSQFPSTKGELLKFLCIQNRYLTFISFSSRNVWLYMLWMFFIFLSIRKLQTLEKRTHLLFLWGKKYWDIFLGYDTNWKK